MSHAGALLSVWFSRYQGTFLKTCSFTSSQRQKNEASVTGSRPKRPQQPGLSGDRTQRPGAHSGQEAECMGHAHCFPS